MLFPKIEFAAENPKSVLNSSTCNLRSEVKPESKKNPSKSEKNKPVSFSLGRLQEVVNVYLETALILIAFQPSVLEQLPTNFGISEMGKLQPALLSIIVIFHLEITKLN